MFNAGADLSFDRIDIGILAFIHHTGFCICQGAGHSFPVHHAGNADLFGYQLGGADENQQKALEKYDASKASLSTWIYTITRNTVYDYLREKRDRPALELLDFTAVSEEETYEPVMQRETLEELACALEKLPQDQRDIIILLYYKKLERKNVAQMLGMTYGQLRYLHDKAIHRLGELLHIK